MIASSIFATLAWAEPEILPPNQPVKEPFYHGTRVILRGLGESLNDKGVDTFYGAGFLTAGVGVVVPIWRGLGVDVEASYARLASENGSENKLDLIPLSLLPEWNFTDKSERFSFFSGLGPTFTGFSERHAPNLEGQTITRGGRIGLEVRAGLRFDTRLIRTAMPPANVSPLSALEVEVYFGRRFQVPHKAGWGFDLASWRGAVGLGLRF